MERLLLVEDDATNRSILTAYLSKAGYAIDVAEDGVIAWQKLAASEYSLVVTDRNMPHMDGLQLFLRMQATEKLRDLYVIMQTAANTPKEIAEGIDAGVYYYLTKPYEEKMLLSLVRAALKASKQRQWVHAQMARQKNALGKFVHGEFHIQTPEEAQNVAMLLGSLFPRSEHAVSGMYELLLNAIEHGNLGIGFEEKGRLLAAATWEKEIAERLKKPEMQAREVNVQFVQKKDQIETVITDQGPGFDWRPYMEIEPSRATRGNGRGIAKANLLSFDQVSYQGSGNQVQIISKLPAS